MALTDLINRTLTHAVNRKDGVGEKVFYTSLDGRYSRFLTTSIIERNVEEDVVGKEEKEFILFHGVTLDQHPSTGDTIQFENRDYTFHRTSDCFGDQYDLIAYIKKHVLGRSRR